MAEGGHSLRVEAVTDPRPVDRATDQPGLLEHLQVLRYGRLGERELVDNLAADATAPLGKDAQDRQPGRVRERLERGGETR